jgi:hypothetical protein
LHSHHSVDPSRRRRHALAAAGRRSSAADLARGGVVGHARFGSWVVQGDLTWEATACQVHPAKCPVAWRRPARRVRAARVPDRRTVETTVRRRPSIVRWPHDRPGPSAARANRRAATPARPMPQASLAPVWDRRCDARKAVVSGLRRVCHRLYSSSAESIDRYVVHSPWPMYAKAAALLEYKQWHTINGIR